MSSVVETFEAQVARAPDAVALEAGTRMLTYAELNARANQLAHVLAADGVGPEHKVGLYVGRTEEIVIGILGILKAGAAYVPMDPVYPAERLAHIVEDAGVSIVVTTSSRAHELPARARALVIDTDEKVAAAPTTNLGATIAADHLAYIIFTSGSTGRPKGVMVTHGNVARLFTSTDAWFRFGADDVWTLFHSYAFDFSVWEIWGALLYGGRVVVVPTDIAWSPDAFYGFLADKRVTVLNQTPSYFQRVIDAEGLRDGVAPLSLRWVIFGGEALNPRMLGPWFERHGDTEPRLVNMFGITETTVHVTYRPLSAHDAASSASLIGTPIPDLTVHVLDGELRPVASGTEGELYVGGAGVARGYVANPELTAQRFVRDPFASEDTARLYRTGDLARRLPDGDLEYLGRSDQQVKIRGFRIELGEIESVLRLHASLADVVVAVHTPSGGDPRLVAYAVPRDKGAELDVPTLRTYAREKLPAYMVPSAFVAISAVPLTTNGKTDRRALPPPPDARAGLGEHVPARDASEAALVNLWEDELGISPIGVTDDFFDLGGHSLLAVRLMGRIARELQKTLPIAALVQHPTVRELAPLLAGDAGIPSTLVLLHQGTSRPLFLVHPIGGNVFCYVELARHLGAAQTVYGIQQQGLDGKQAPIVGITEQAKTYIAAIRTVQPDGPYLLGGWSYGGTLAYEMACLLEQSGHTVELLANLDARASSEETRTKAVQIMRNYDPAVMAFWFTVIMSRIGGVESPLSLSDFQGLDDDARLARMVAEITPHAEGSTVEQLRTSFRLFVNNLRSLNGYPPKTFNGTMTLVRATIPVERLPDRPTPPPWGWEPYCAKIEQHDVANTHFMLLNANRLGLVSAPLADALARAHARIARSP